MRLRRETGDFLIKCMTTTDIDQETGEETGVTIAYNTIRPGLSMEDLMGEMVAFYNDGKLTSMAAVTSVSLNDKAPNIILLSTQADEPLTYNRTTGEITNGETNNIYPGSGGLTPADGSTVGGGSL